MKRVILFLLFLYATQAGWAQVAGQQVPVTIPGYGSGPNALVYLPWNYNVSGKNYPLIVFGHGISETTVGSLPNQGLPGIIAQNNPPYAIENGDTVRFIVLSPTDGAFVSEQAMSDGAKYLIGLGLHIDTNRVYITGLSAGARSTVGYISHQAANHYQTAYAAVPMSYTLQVSEMDGGYWVGPFSNFAGKGVWAFTGQYDVHTAVAQALVDSVNVYSPGNGRLTIYPGGHCCWMTYYDPAYRENINGKMMNIYEWMLQFHGNAPSSPPLPIHQPPVANAGSNQTITLPVDSVSLDGLASSDSDGTIISYKWVQLSGPSASVIKQDTSAKTEVTGLDTGVYVFTLTVKDDSGAAASANVTITVKGSVVTPPPVHRPPVANAGSNQTITLPVDSVLLDGSASVDSNGKIVSYQWMQQSGPSTAAIAGDTLVKTKVSGLDTGVYVFILTVKDDSGASASANVTITVKDSVLTPPVHQPPVANAGSNQTIILPVDSVLLDGSASYDSGGTIVSYQWSQQSGPAPYTFSNADSVKTKVKLPVPGTYVFALTVTNNAGYIDTSLVTVTVNGTYNGLPVANAGNDTTIYYPLSFVYLNGSKSYTNGGILYLWKQISGPTTDIIMNTTRAYTKVEDLVPGVYVFQLTVWDYGRNSDSARVTVTVLPDPMQPGDVPYTANTYVSPYNQPFQYGTNPSAYNGWNDTAIAGIAVQAGAHSLRLPLPDYFVQHYGYDVRLNEFNYYTHQLGMKEITLFVGEPSSGDADDSTYAPATSSSDVFKNLYSPIWDNGQNGTPVNDSNYFALYIYNLVKMYGKNIRFWEIVNEADATGFWDNGNTLRSDNWWVTPPGPGALLNIKAPVYYYIRMLRIAYEIVKKFYPDEYICTGGIGYPAFLDALLRYTDNPDSGKVTPEYPLTGGAYFDVVSFHCYPAYSLQVWDNSIGGFQWHRYSDYAANAIIALKSTFDSVLNIHGYNGMEYPKKPFIITESNIPRESFGTYFGSDSAQFNFIIKALVKSQQNDIRQFYIYQIGETSDYSSATDPYQLMGLYQNLNGASYGRQKLTDEGKAYKTTSMFLYGWEYDSARTAKLNLPLGVDGAAFRQDTSFRYVLWAKTHTDLSEVANAAYSFPSALNIDSVYRYNWDYSVNPHDSAHISAQNIALTGTPAFFTVSPVPDTIKVPPVADAGKNQTITLPTNSVTLDGSASADMDGTIISYKWTLVSGPSAYSIMDSNAVKTQVTGLSVGVYTFTLTVTDNKGATASDNVVITVNASANVIPVANAGQNQSITLPLDSVTLDGSASYDPYGSISSYKWTVQSGPSSYIFGHADRAKTIVSNLVAGTYVFTLTVTDTGGAYATSNVTVYVNEVPNKPPVANAGSNITIQLPVDSVLLDGSKSYDPDGTIVGYQWDQNSGPSTASFGRQNGPQVTAFHLTAGTYVFSLIVKDNQGAGDTALVTVTVKSANNQAPIANAGANIAIQLPVDSALLNGSASYDPDGNIVSWKWAQKSGPASYTIQKDTSSQTMVTGLVQGVYVFTLTVTDNDGAISSSSVAITVSGKDSVSSGPPPVIAPNQSPVANAGRNQIISLPADSAALDGSASYDPDGKIVSWKWVKKSGPSAAVLNNDTVATTLVSGLVAGTYVFTLTVTDNNGGTSSADVSVFVNQPPVAKAGQNQVINLPAASVTLDGSASYDPDGKIVSWQWVEQSGPSPIVINNNGNPVINPYGLVVGTYVFTLTVTDNNGAASSANVSIRVNHPPVANAGNNVNIFLPVDSTLLDGSASNDPDGSIVSWSWTQRSGPSSANIVQAANAKTQVNSLVNGVYVFTLIVTDNDGAKDTADVTIGVYEKPSQPPVADAGKDITIVLPQNSVTLDGTASHDPDGTIVSYHWDPMTGPTQPKLHTPDASITIVSGLQMGTYDFKLTVTDNKGMSSTATVSVYVMPGRDTTPITFIIYPNPVHDELHVELNKAITGLLTFRIIDVNGRIMKQYYFGQLPMHTTKVLDVSGLAPGIYFIQLIEDNQLRDVRKMIKY